MRPLAAIDRGTSGCDGEYSKTSTIEGLGGLITTAAMNNKVLRGDRRVKVSVYGMQTQKQIKRRSKKKRQESERAERGCIHQLESQFYICLAEFYFDGINPGKEQRTPHRQSINRPLSRYLAFLSSSLWTW